MSGLSFAFGGDTDMSYEDLRRRQQHASGMMQRGSNARPRNFWEGANSAANSILGALMTKRLGERETENREQATSVFQEVLAQRYGAPAPTIAPMGGGSASRETPDFNANSLGGPSAMIREFEGYSETPYWDVNAHRAGYGSDTVTMADGSVVPITPGMTVNRADAERDLDRRINTEFLPSARNAVGAEIFDGLNSQQQSALTSLAYNYGAGAWQDDLAGVAQAARTGGNVAGAISALGSHNNGINRNRREREAAAFGMGGAGHSGSVQQRVAANMGGMSPILEAMANPYMSQQQQSVLGMLLQQRIAANQPLSEMDRLNIERGRLENQQLRNSMNTPPERERIQDANGRWRYVDNRELVFPDVETTPEWSDLTPEDLAQYPNLDPTRTYQRSQDGQLRVVGGGGTNVTVNNGGDVGETEFDKVTGRELAQSVNETANAGDAARQNLARIGRLEGLLAESPTGLEGAIRGLAGSIGLGNLANASDLQAAQALINAMVPEQRAPGSGPMSDADLALFKESLPRIINSADGNAKIIQTLRGIAQYDMERGQLARDLQQRKITREQYFSGLANLSNPLAWLNDSGSSASDDPLGLR